MEWQTAAILQQRDHADRRRIVLLRSHAFGRFGREHLPAKIAAERSPNQKGGKRNRESTLIDANKDATFASIRVHSWLESGLFVVRRILAKEQDSEASAAQRSQKFRESLDPELLNTNRGRMLFFRV